MRLLLEIPDLEREGEEGKLENYERITTSDSLIKNK
jgi:hypothetical protein